MDSETLEAYEAHGERLASEYREHKRVSGEKFERAFPNHSRILEVGVGSGIDFSVMIKAGFEVLGLEPSKELQKYAERFFPEVRGRVVADAFPLERERLKKWGFSFDGIHCCAVVMHFKKKDRPLIWEQFGTLLRKGGRLFCRFSETRDGLDEQGRDAMGRFYQILSEGEILNECENAGFRLLEKWEDKSVSFSRGKGWKSHIYEWNGSD